ncbi:MAG TPA: DUF2231 domain-containing protein [Gemmatimonadales bacterium]|nr:DUF2231 domain-containing protein [Gemmatimonadales bacterium]
MFGYDWPRLHAALNDLPTALLLTAALFELLALTTRKESFRQVSFWTLMVGALGGVAAVLSGLQAEENIAHGDAVHRVMETHELLAFVTLGTFGALAGWRLWRERRMGTAERAVALAATLAGAGVLIATSVYGGRLVFDHAAGIPTEVLTTETRERSRDHEHAPGEGHAEGGHTHDAPAGATADSTAPSSGGDHVDPPGTPPHSHEPAATQEGHSHPPGTAPHEH